jgi:hypothetical protein
MFLSSCSVLQHVSDVPYFQREHYRYDNKYTGIDTLINIDGYYMFQNENVFFNDEIMFFPNGEVTCFKFKENFEEIEYEYWGKYLLNHDTIKMQAYDFWGITWINTYDNIEQWFKVSNDTTLIRFIKCFGCFDDFYTGRTISDTLRFVKWEALEDTTKYNYILEQNWLRPLKKNWKEGTYPGNEE